MRLKTLQTEIEADLALAKKLVRDSPAESPEHAMLSEVVAYLEKALNAFQRKPEGEK